MPHAKAIAASNGTISLGARFMIHSSYVGLPGKFSRNPDTQRSGLWMRSERCAATAGWPLTAAPHPLVKAVREIPAWRPVRERQQQHEDEPDEKRPPHESHCARKKVRVGGIAQPELGTELGFAGGAR